MKKRVGSALAATLFRGISNSHKEAFASIQGGLHSGSKTPSLGKTALLPFEGSVVFAAIILNSTIGFGTDITEMIEEDLVCFRKK